MMVKQMGTKPAYLEIFVFFLRQFSTKLSGFRAGNFLEETHPGNELRAGDPFWGLLKSDPLNS